MNSSEFGNITFDLPKNQSNVIKVIGVGGGGSNATNHMFRQGIKGVDFIVCNTDSQALQNSAVLNKIQLGVNLTEGLGAGANPSIGQQSALESMPELEKMLDTNTRMIFITAGMGGGTGTGAAPVIAQLAKEKKILTVGIVTIPFHFEGKTRTEQALVGVEKLRKHVDSLVIVNNNKLREVYGNLGFKAGFSKADEVLATAAKGIAEVITHHYTQNIDLEDARTVLSNSGTAIMGSSTASGEYRAKEAIVNALDSPLLNDNKISGAKNVLLLIVSGTIEITMDEIAEINEYIQSEAGNGANIIMGVGEDENLGEAIAVTIIATGFNVEQQNEIVNTEPKKIIHSLEDEQKQTFDLSQNKITKIFDTVKEVNLSPVPNKVVYNLMEDEEELQDRIDNKIIQEVEDFEIVVPVMEQDSIDIKLRDKTIHKEGEEEITFSFDLPIKKESSDYDRQVTLQEQSIIQEQEPLEKAIIKYSLEEYLEEQDTSYLSKKHKKEQEESVDKELDIKMKKITDGQELLLKQDHSRNIKKEEIQQSLFDEFQVTFEQLAPIDMTIEDTLRMRAEERRKKMKQFNYKFNSKPKSANLEREPAYKRMGLDINTKIIDNSNLGTSLGTNSHDELKLRSNNSFLHDNVD